MRLRELSSSRGSVQGAHVAVGSFMGPQSALAEFARDARYSAFVKHAPASTGCGESGPVIDQLSCVTHPQLVRVPRRRPPCTVAEGCPARVQVNSVLCTVAHADTRRAALIASTSLGVQVCYAEQAH